ncbi:7-deoxyloganetin glucosyltransferase-like isoform X1 [Populus trichocarpa]|nr:7-deoxyloganetin glucosyltransferase-like isoform X1 [Populus trichocarpa]
MADKPHAVLIPLPFQSHIKSMLKLAKLLHHRGFHITFVNTEYNHRRLLKSRGPNSLNGLLDFRFENIPDGLPHLDIDASQDILALFEAIKNNSMAPFMSDLLNKLNETATSNVPPVTCIVSDFLLFTIATAEERGIPIALFQTASACCFMCFKQLRPLKEKGLAPIKDDSFLTNDFLNKVIDWIPGMIGIRVRDLPRFFRWMDLNDCWFNHTMESAEKACKASAIIVHSFDALEQEVLNALYSMFPRVYPIGPLQLLLNQVPEDDLNSIGCNLWKEEPECLQWLDSKKPKSVVYVNFGSIVVMNKEQLIEFGMGLSESNHSFVWIIRPDMVIGQSAIFPAEFMEETKERGFIANWCPQEEVLNHPSIGGFITHCGWGSTIESISSGVPMLCCPFFGDQQTNCRYACSEWGIGMEIDNDINRENVKTLVRELMEGEKGKKMKKQAMERKKLAVEATAPNGTSSMNLDKLINEVLLSRN